MIPLNELDWAIATLHNRASDPDREDSDRLAAAQALLNTARLADQPGAVRNAIELLKELASTTSNSAVFLDAVHTVITGEQPYPTREDEPKPPYYVRGLTDEP